MQKKIFGHFRVGQIFFVENQKIEIKLQKLQTLDPKGDHFFWPKMFPDQFTMKFKNKKSTFFHFLGFFAIWYTLFFKI